MNKQTRYILLGAAFASIYVVGSYLHSRAQSLADSAQVIDSQRTGWTEAVSELATEGSGESLIRPDVTQALAMAEQQNSDSATSSLEAVTERLANSLSQQQGSDTGTLTTAEQNVTRSSLQGLSGPSSASAGQTVAGSQQNQGAGLLPPLPTRLEVAAPGGDAVYVEIEIAPGIRTIEREWIMLVTEEQRQQLFIDAPELLPFLIESTGFGALNAEILTFEVPASLDVNGGVLELVPENFRQLMDRNHIYQVQSLEEQSDTPAARPLSVGDRVSLQTPMSAVCDDPVSIGMIDSAIHNGHAVFRDLADGRLQIQRFLAPELISPISHGTAVASVLIGEDPSLGPLLPNARVFSATAVHGQDRYRQGATAANLMRALGWLMEKQVSVINISLTGPENRVLKQALDLAMESGVSIVAAAGNQGAHAPPVYPAAYPGVTAVTAVNHQGEIYRWANQGDHIDFAALGVDLPVARDDGRVGTLSGTSLASPIVAAFLACAAAQASGNMQLAYRQLQSASRDMGEPGRDNIFGFGLLHPSVSN